MGNTSAGGGRHKSGHKEADEAGRRGRPGHVQPSPSPRRGSDPDKNKSILIESPREMPDEVLSRLLDGYQSDRINSQMRQLSLVSPPGSSLVSAAGLQHQHMPPVSGTLPVFSIDQRSSSCQAITSAAEGSHRKLQCMFKWAGGGKKVYLAGAFTDPPWQTRLPMHRSKSANFYTIHDLPVGRHDYCFLVDGQWRVDNNQPMHSGRFTHQEAHHQTSPSPSAGDRPPPQTNCLEVKESDFEVFNALEADFAEATDRKQQKEQTNREAGARTPTTAAKVATKMASASRSSFGRPGSPPGDYTREVPSPARLMLEASDHPPLLPPVLLDGILNADTSAHYDPNLMPIPQHVMLNHLYCLSIKDGMMILAATARYRKKFVSTVFYRPIESETMKRAAAAAAAAAAAEEATTSGDRP